MADNVYWSWSLRENVWGVAQRSRSPELVKILWENRKNIDFNKDELKQLKALRKELGL
jgi:hypothetical protein